MKRKFAILLSAMLLMQAVCGCGGAASSGTSSASASTGSIASKSSEKAVIVTDEQDFTHENGITRLAKEIYGDLNVEFFVLSEDAQERETQISSLRVEIMAGGGPDGYLLSSPTSNMTFNGEGHPATLFPDVQRTMQAGAFLPLDDYIKESEYLRSEDHFALFSIPEKPTKDRSCCLSRTTQVFFSSIKHSLPTPISPPKHGTSL